MNSFDLNPFIQKEELPTKVFIGKPWPYDYFLPSLILRGIFLVKFLRRVSENLGQIVNKPLLVLQPGKFPFSLSSNRDVWGRSRNTFMAIKWERGRRTKCLLNLSENVHYQTRDGSYIKRFFSSMDIIHKQRDYYK